MRQIFQNFRTGELEIEEVPCPLPGPGEILIRSRFSLISAGTERMLVEFGQASLIQKARQQPEKVRQVLEKIRSDGLIPTMEAVFRKLGEPIPLGYCNSGVVLEIGSGINDILPGDRVASNGPHAEIVCVPRNLCARIPDPVSDEEAAFTVLAGIALQGIRLADPTFGETFLVFGMGLIGLLTVQLLAATGCKVIAVDLNEARLNLAQIFGAIPVNIAKGTDPVIAVHSLTQGTGVDGAILCAAAPNDNEIIHQAAESCRRRGRIIQTGVTGLNLRRPDFYKKELTFQVSCSYGPGRYEDLYEKKGFDYPIGFVRWTEQRNFQAVLGAMESGKLKTSSLITDRFSLSDAAQAYHLIRTDPASLAVLIHYPGEESEKIRKTVHIAERSTSPAGKLVVGVIGAGAFARSTLLPALQAASARLKWIAARGGASASQLARKFHVEQATSDVDLLLKDPEVGAVFILTGHSSHADLACRALEAGKHVFVEKPLAITPEQLNRVRETFSAYSDRQLAVGFNRRFSPHTQRIRLLLEGRSEPLCMHMTINAGAIPPDQWMQDPLVGGGRIIGEGCHFVDLLAYIAQSRVSSVYAKHIGGGAPVLSDKMALLLCFEDGSIGTVDYYSNGCRSYAKERLEVFSDGRVLVLDNFRVTRGFGISGFGRYKTIRQNKGHFEEVAKFLERVSAGGEPLMPFGGLENTTRATFAAMESCMSGKQVSIS